MELVLRDILKIRASEMAFPGVFKSYFPPRTTCCFVRNYTCKTGNNATEMSQAFHDITRIEHFTILFVGAYVLLTVIMVEGDESSRLRMAN